MDLSKIKKIHFVGIGGIGTSAAAKMMLRGGKSVSGSDVAESEITEELERLGAKIFTPHHSDIHRRVPGQVGHRAENLADDVDLVIYSPAVSKDNVERRRAEHFAIPQYSYPEFLGELSKDKFTIAISGTNGKSTTTAMLGLILEQAGLDPTVIVGSKVPQWQGNLRLGQSKYFVVEACEWRAHMLNLNPQIIILTNLEEDHLDYYQNIDHIIRTFQKYIDKLPSKGILILNADDLNLKRLKPKCKVITYGINNKADLMAKNIVVRNSRQEFDLIHNFRQRWTSPGLAKFMIHNSIRVPGIFNIYNALAASAAAWSLGVKPKKIIEALKDFKGIWRRFELIKPQINADQDADKRGYDIGVNQRSNQRKSAIFISDYGHHPTAVRETIKATKEFYPGHRIIVVFQPHHRNRTKKLFNNFVKSFDMADLVIISEIYDVAGRENLEDIDISSKDLVEAIIKHQKTIPLIRANRGNNEFIWYAADLAETKNRLLEVIQPNDIVLVMGAGDIYKVISNF